MPSAEEYVERYKYLERIVRQVYNLKNEESIVQGLRKSNRFNAYIDAIKYCADVRNLLQHQQKISSNYPVVPSREMIEFLDMVIKKLENLPRCKDIQISLKDVCWRSLDANVSEAMRRMRENSFTHIPILENNIVIGVFDENSIFNYLATERCVDIDDLTFEDIRDFLLIEGRELEEFVFVKATDYVEDIERNIKLSFDNGKRVGMAFVTRDGREHDELMGIITPWDIIGNFDR